MKKTLVRERLPLKPAPRFKPQPRKADRLTLLEAAHDPNIFQPSLPEPDDWTSWFAFLAAIFAYDMTPEQRALFEKCTGRKTPPAKQVKEAWLIAGRRAGKSRVLALCAVWLAAFFNYKPYLARGQRAVVQVMAADREQTREIMDYIKGFLAGSRMLARLVQSSTSKWVRLNNAVSIEVTTASYKTSRGRTTVAILADELAFWSSEDSTNPDTEVIAAARPSMLTIPNSMLLCASSPHARKGALWQAYKKHYGQESERIVVWQADTLTMRPNAPTYVREEIEQAYNDDPAQASANFGAMFRTDVEQFVTMEAVEACLSEERERPYLSQHKYHAFVDPSGGSGKDSFTLAIGHSEKGIATLDVLREYKPSFSPKNVVSSCADILKAYGVVKIIGDRFAGEWPREQFKDAGVIYEASAKPKSQIYSEFLAVLNSKTCSLIDNPRMITQLLALERRAVRSGREVIDHPVNGHDDLINAAAGLTVMCLGGGAKRYRYDASLNWVGGIDPSQRERSPAAEQLSHFLATRGLR
ncbi:hypothetical protein [Bradyrhizobium diazoefficiens]|uniref:hypothetical protein n=1 Tax=Bradyrhizobium diazoefficiens TaxID=1355477 RepID=UPI003497BEEC